MRDARWLLGRFVQGPKGKRPEQRVRRATTLAILLAVRRLGDTHFMRLHGTGKVAQNMTRESGLRSGRV